MSEHNTWESIKKFVTRIGRRNLIIAGAVLMIGLAVALNWVFFSSGEDKGDGFQYDASAGMSTDYGTTMKPGEIGTDANVDADTNANTNASDNYFSSVAVSRQRARDEALEVLNAVVDNEKADQAVKAEALKEIQTIAKEMEQEANIESVLVSKGFEQCVAVISGDSANVVVKHDGALQPAQLAQINAAVYEQTGIEPINITIVQKS